MQKIGAHDHVVRLLHFGRDDYVNTAKNKSRPVDYLVLELARGGELFDFLAISGSFDESLARYYMHQLLSAIEFCHRNNIVHRDLKPENLLLDQDYKLKVADFGFAKDLDEFGDSMMSTRCGTLPYMAPEIHNKEGYKGQTVDMFSAAIILFVMVAQHQPFGQANEDDKFYKCFYRNRTDVFWKTMCKRQGRDDAFTSDFMDLMNCMLQPDPVHRPSIYEIKRHKWFEGPIPSEKDVISQFMQRHQLVRDELANQQ